MMTKRRSSQIVSVKLRLREELRRLVEKEARKSDWSLNREMVRRIERSFAQQETKVLIQEVVSETLKQQSMVA